MRQKYKTFGCIVFFTLLFSYVESTLYYRYEDVDPEDYEVFRRHYSTDDYSWFLDRINEPNVPKIVILRRLRNDVSKFGQRLADRLFQTQLYRFKSFQNTERHNPALLTLSPEARRIKRYLVDLQYNQRISWLETCRRQNDLILAQSHQIRNELGTTLNAACVVGGRTLEGLAVPYCDSLAPEEDDSPSSLYPSGNPSQLERTLLDETLIDDLHSESTKHQHETNVDIARQRKLLEELDRKSKESKKKSKKHLHLEKNSSMKKVDEEAEEKLEHKQRSNQLSQDEIQVLGDLCHRYIAKSHKEKKIDEEEDKEDKRKRKEEEDRLKKEKDDLKEAQEQHKKDEEEKKKKQEDDEAKRTQEDDDLTKKTADDHHEEHHTLKEKWIPKEESGVLLAKNVRYRPGDVHHEEKDQVSPRKGYLRALNVIDKFRNPKGNGQRVNSDEDEEHQRPKPTIERHFEPGNVQKAQFKPRILPITPNFEPIKQDNDNRRIRILPHEEDKGDKVSKKDLRRPFEAKEKIKKSKPKGRWVYSDGDEDSLKPKSTINRSPEALRTLKKVENTQFNHNVTPRHPNQELHDDNKFKPFNKPSEMNQQNLGPRKAPQAVSFRQKLPFDLKNAPRISQDHRQQSFSKPSSSSSSSPHQIRHHQEEQLRNRPDQRQPLLHRTQHENIGDHHEKSDHPMPLQEHQEHVHHEQQGVPFRSHAQEIANSKPIHRIPLTKARPHKDNDVVQHPIVKLYQPPISKDNIVDPRNVQRTRHVKHHQPVDARVIQIPNIYQHDKHDDIAANVKRIVPLITGNKRPVQHEEGYVQPDLRVQSISIQTEHKNHDNEDMRVRVKPVDHHSLKPTPVHQHHHDSRREPNVEQHRMPLNPIRNHPIQQEKQVQIEGNHPVKSVAHEGPDNVRSEPFKADNHPKPSLNFNPQRRHSQEEEDKPKIIPIIQQQRQELPRTFIQHSSRPISHEEDQRIDPIPRRNHPPSSLDEHVEHHPRILEKIVPFEGLQRRIPPYDHSRIPGLKFIDNQRKRRPVILNRPDQSDQGEHLQVDPRVQKNHIVNPNELQDHQGPQQEIRKVISPELPRQPDQNNPRSQHGDQRAHIDKDNIRRPNGVEGHQHQTLKKPIYSPLGVPTSRNTERDHLHNDPRIQIEKDNIRSPNGVQGHVGPQHQQRGKAKSLSSSKPRNPFRQDEGGHNNLISPPLDHHQPPNPSSVHTQVNPRIFKQQQPSSSPNGQQNYREHHPQDISHHIKPEMIKDPRISVPEHEEDHKKKLFSPPYHSQDPRVLVKPLDKRISIEKPLNPIGHQTRDHVQHAPQGVIQPHGEDPPIQRDQSHKMRPRLRPNDGRIEHLQQHQSRRPQNPSGEDVVLHKPKENIVVSKKDQIAPMVHNPQYRPKIILDGRPRIVNRQDLKRILHNTKPKTAHKAYRPVDYTTKHNLEEGSGPLGQSRSSSDSQMGTPPTSQGEHHSRSLEMPHNQGVGHEQHLLPRPKQIKILNAHPSDEILNHDALHQRSFDPRVEIAEHQEDRRLPPKPRLVNRILQNPQDHAVIGKTRPRLGVDLLDTNDRHVPKEEVDGGQHNEQFDGHQRRPQPSPLYQGVSQRKRLPGIGIYRPDRIEKTSNPILISNKAVVHQFPPRQEQGYHERLEVAPELRERKDEEDPRTPDESEEADRSIADSIKPRLAIRLHKLPPNQPKSSKKHHKQPKKHKIDGRTKVIPGARKEAHRIIMLPNRQEDNEGSRKEPNQPIRRVKVINQRQFYPTPPQEAHNSFSEGGRQGVQGEINRIPEVVNEEKAIRFPANIPSQGTQTQRSSISSEGNKPNPGSIRPISHNEKRFEQVNIQPTRLAKPEAHYNHAINGHTGEESKSIKVPDEKLISKEKMIEIRPENRPSGEATFHQHQPTHKIIVGPVTHQTYRQTFRTSPSESGEVNQITGARALPSWSYQRTPVRPEGHQVHLQTSKTSEGPQLHNRYNTQKKPEASEGFAQQEHTVRTAGDGLHWSPMIEIKPVHGEGGYSTIEGHKKQVGQDEAIQEPRIISSHQANPAPQAQVASSQEAEGRIAIPLDWTEKFPYDIFGLPRPPPKAPKGRKKGKWLFVPE